MKKYLAIPALATLTTLAALAVTGCGTPTSPAAVTTPDAQQLASCQYANNNCPLGHAYKMYGNVGRPTQYSSPSPLTRWSQSRATWSASNSPYTA